MTGGAREGNMVGAESRRLIGKRAVIDLEPPWGWTQKGSKKSPGAALGREAVCPIAARIGRQSKGKSGMKEESARAAFLDPLHPVVPSRTEEDLPKCSKDVTTLNRRAPASNNTDLPPASPQACPCTSNIRSSDARKERINFNFQV